MAVISGDELMPYAVDNFNVVVLFAVEGAN